MLRPEAQRMAADLHYAPLPVPVIELLQKRLTAAIPGPAVQAHMSSQPQTVS
jgi:hypothetical protein